MGNLAIWQFNSERTLGGKSAAPVIKLRNFQITKLQNFYRLVLPYYEIDPPVDNLSYLP
jgi:hypothetical protein